VTIFRIVALDPIRDPDLTPSVLLRGATAASRWLELRDLALEGPNATAVAPMCATIAWGSPRSELVSRCRTISGLMLAASRSISSRRAGQKAESSLRAATPARRPS
jgi:hypothetical protein